MQWLLAGVQATLAAIGLAATFGTRPWLLGAGLALAAGAPLAFMLRHHLAGTATGQSGSRFHPVGTSAASGLGCVIVMAGVYRYGEARQWLLALSVCALVLWMVWQKWLWRR